MKTIGAMILLTILTAVSVQAQPANTGGQSAQTLSPTRYQKSFEQKGPLFQLGADVRGRRDEDQQMRTQTMPNIAAGYEWGHWIFIGEYGYFAESTGNQTLSVDHKFETLMGWAYWQATDMRWIAPFAGAGLGAQRETVQTNFSGQTDSDTSGNYLTAAGSFGVRFFPHSPLWLSLEGRLYKNAHQDPDPQLGGLAKIGFVIR